jgi:hypothetical protein
MILFAIVGLAPLAVGCGSGEVGEESGAEEAVRDEAEIRKLSPAARLARLASLLRKDNAVKMPPLGVQHAANVMDSHVDLLAASSTPLKEILSKRVTDDAPDVGPLKDMFFYGDEGDPDVVAALASGNDADLEGNDKYAKIEFGRNDSQIKKFFVEDLVAPSERAAVKALLSGLDADFARLTIYDTGAELNAVDVIAIRPNVAGARTLVFQVTYAHA